MMTAELELGQQVANRTPQDEHEARCLGLWLRHEREAEKVERQAAPKPAPRTLYLTSELAEAAQVLGARRRPAREEAVDLTGIEGVRAVLGIRPMPAGVPVDVAALNEAQRKRDRAVELEVARLTREAGTVAAERYRQSQQAPATPREPTEAEKADQVVRAALSRILAAMHRSVAEDGFAGDAPLREEHQWSSDGRYQGPADTLGAEYVRRLNDMRNCSLAVFAEQTRYHANPAANARPLQAPRPVDIRSLVGLYAIPAHTVTAWLADSDVHQRYGLADILAVE